MLRQLLRASEIAGYLSFLQLGDTRAEARTEISQAVDRRARNVLSSPLHRDRETPKSSAQRPVIVQFVVESRGGMSRSEQRDK